MWYFLFPFFAKGVYFSLKNNSRHMVSIFAYVGFMLVFLALLEGNMGTIFRHKSLALNFLFIFTAAGLWAVGKKRRIAELASELKK